MTLTRAVLLARLFQYKLKIVQACVSFNAATFDVRFVVYLTRLADSALHSRVGSSTNSARQWTGSFRRSTVLHVVTFNM